jgi:hypothetical protein
MALDQAKFHWNSSKRKRIGGPFSQSVSHGKFGQCDLSLSSSIMNMVKNFFFPPPIYMVQPKWCHHQCLCYLYTGADMNLFIVYIEVFFKINLVKVIW